MNKKEMIVCLALMVLIFGAFLLVTGCEPGLEDPTLEEPTEELEVIKIGVLAPVTGAAAADGEEFVRGAELAVKEINEAGGVLGYQFEVIVGDTADMVPDQVLTALENLAGEPNLGVLITGHASMSNFEIDRVAELNIPYMLGANTAQTRDIISENPGNYPTVWSTNTSYDAYETELPRILEDWENQGLVSLPTRKVALVTSDNPYSMSIYDGLKEEFTTRGWTITVDEMVPFQDVHDWRTIISEIRNDPPDIVINTDFLPANSATFLNQFLDNPTNSYVFLQYAPSVPEFVELTGENSTGVLYNMLGGLIYPEQATKDYIEKFKNEYGVEPGTYGAMLYEQVYIYVDAIHIVGDPLNHTKIGEAIGNMEKMTLFGNLKFDPETHLALQGDEYIPLQFYQIWDGERELVYPDEYKTADFQTPPWMNVN